MNKFFVILTVTLGMVLALTACGRNADTSDNITETKAENQAETQVDIQIEDKAENQDDMQAALQEENVTEHWQVSESAADGNKTESQQVSESASADTGSENEKEMGGQTEMRMNVQVGDYAFTATLENNTAVSELVDMMKDGPVTIAMDDYSGFEKVGSLGRSLTRNDSQTTTHAGDIVLYNGNNIVMFYGSNSWSYTKIGKVDDLTDWEKALGNGSITAVFTLAE